jgi:hypothetical protein
MLAPLTASTAASFSLKIPTNPKRLFSPGATGDRYQRRAGRGARVAVVAKRVHRSQP